MLDEDSISRTVVRLSRPHPSGGRVIERAAVVASGTDSSAILAWIADHGGQAEALSPTGSGEGLHGPRRSEGGANQRRPLRYVIPAEALPGLGEPPAR